MGEFIQARNVTMTIEPTQRTDGDWDIQIRFENADDRDFWVVAEVDFEYAQREEFHWDGTVYAGKSQLWPIPNPLHVDRAECVSLRFEARSLSDMATDHKTISAIRESL